VYTNNRAVLETMSVIGLSSVVVEKKGRGKGERKS